MSIEKANANKPLLPDEEELLNIICNYKENMMRRQLEMSMLILDGLEKYDCDPIVYIYKRRLKSPQIKNFSPFWDVKGTLMLHDLYTNNDNFDYEDLKIFPLNKDLYNNPLTMVYGKGTYYACVQKKVRHIIKTDEDLTICHWEAFDAFYKAKEYLDNYDCAEKHLFVSTDEITDEINRKYEEITKKNEFDYEKNCFDMIDRSKNEGHFKVHMEGDIIITDPCYIIRDRDESTRPKWEDYHKYSSIYEYPDYDEATKSSETFYEEDKKLDAADKEWCKEHPDDRDIWDERDLSPFGFTAYIAHNTLYGDWGCTTYDSDTDKELGEFCADSGMVGVFLLDEVMKYNPDYDDVDKCPYAVTLIKGFKGDVWFEKTYDTLIVKGEGNVNFRTAQTSL